MYPNEIKSLLIIIASIGGGIGFFAGVALYTYVVMNDLPPKVGALALLMMAPTAACISLVFFMLFT